MTVARGGDRDLAALFVYNPHGHVHDQVTQHKV